MLVGAVLAVLAGAVVRGYTGFGSSMFWVASLSLLYAPASVVPTVLALEVVASLSLLPSVVGQVHWQSMSWMLGATVLTMPLGVMLLVVLPARLMRILVAVAILLGTVALASGVRLSGRHGIVTAMTAGSVSGVVNGSTGIGGPPAVLLYFSGASEHRIGRATLIAYFLGTDTIGFAMMAAAGLVAEQVLVHAAIFTPLAFLGITVGQRAFARSSGRDFHKVVVGVLVVLAAAMLVQSVACG